MQTFLLGQAAHHGKNGFVGIDVQAHTRLQRGLVLRLASRFARRVVILQKRVIGRIPDRCIDAIENAGKNSNALTQQPIQSTALFGRGDFARISRRHRGNPVSKEDASFHKGNLAMVFKPLHRKEGLGQVQLDKVTGAENALVSEVMDREHAFGRMASSSQIGWRQTGVPVMAMHHLRAPQAVHARSQASSNPTQERKAQVVVRISNATGVLIRIARAIVKLRRVDHIQRDAVPGLAKQ